MLFDFSVGETYQVARETYQVARETYQVARETCQIIYRIRFNLPSRPTYQYNEFDPCHNLET